MLTVVLDRLTSERSMCEAGSAGITSAGQTPAEPDIYLNPAGHTTHRTDGRTAGTAVGYRSQSKKKKLTKKKCVLKTMCKLQG